MAISLATSARNAMCDALVDLADAGSGAGKIEIRTASRPANPNTSSSGTTLLATVTLIDPAFGASSTGVATLADPVSVTGVAAGTAAWFRMLDSNDAAVIDGTVTATGGGGDLTLSTTTISIGLTIDITGGTVTVPVGG